MTIRGIGTGLMVAAAVLALTGCDDMVGFGHARQDFHYSYPLQPGGHLDLDNRNGSVEISGWDRNTIDVSGTKYAPTDDRLSDVQIKVSASGNEASVRTEAPAHSFAGGYGAHYVIRVPREIALGSVQTTNGSFSAEDLQGGGNLNSTNGRISLARDTGDYNVRTTNGTIEIQECSGNERAQTVNGSVRGRLRSGSIDAHTTNGSIDFTIEKPQDGQPLRASTTNGGITLTLPELHGNSVNADTTHGTITLRVPSNADATVEAHTSFARITTGDLTLTSTEQASRHELRGKLGKGGPLISLTTTTGNVRIERY